MPDITEEALNGVYDAVATIPTGRPMMAIFNGIICKEAYPTDHGSWVVLDPSRICPDGPQDLVCVKATRDEIWDLLDESLKSTLCLV